MTTTQTRIAEALALIDDLIQAEADAGNHINVARLERAHDTLDALIERPARQSAGDALRQLHLETEAALVHLTPHQRVTYTVARREHVHAEALAIAESAAA